MAVARERQLRQRVGGKHADLEHFDTRGRLLGAGEPRAVGDPDDAGRVALRYVIDTDQRRELDGHADLFHAFTHRRVGRMLVVVDEPAG